MQAIDSKIRGCECRYKGVWKRMFETFGMDCKKMKKILPAKGRF